MRARRKAAGAPFTENEPRPMEPGMETKARMDSRTAIDPIPDDGMANDVTTNRNEMDKKLPLARVAGLLTALLAAAGLASAQEKEKERPMLQLPGMSGMSPEQEEMIRLFHEVERTLGAIDVELFDASAGRIPVPEGKESGIERLLRSNGTKSDEAVTGIERILELAEQMGNKSCSQCMKPGQSPAPSKEGKSPLDQERQRGPTQGEKTPEAPEPKPGEQGKEQEQPKPKPGGEKPDDRGQNPPTGENIPSTPRVDESGNPIQHGDDAERWGVLPERVRSVFQNQITDDLPLQYRDWIDSYYRRMNRSH